MAQATRLQSQLLALHADLDVEIVVVKTSGDQGNRDQLGAFVKEIQDALLDNRVDVALHCLKDLPTQQATGLVLAAYLPREDAHDTIITRGQDWEELATGSVIGTGSVRRTSQLAAMRADFKFKRLIGNVDTRLRKLQEGEYDAIILAIAGLKRLGVLERWSESEYRELKVTSLSNEVMLPAPGQAVLALETREDDQRSQSIVSQLHHEPSRLVASAERAFLKAFGGGCSVPVAAYAEITGNRLELEGLVAAPDGSQVIQGRNAGDPSQAESIGEALAVQLLAKGALELFQTGVTG